MSLLRSIILAAGKGTRMKSEVPKVLHPIAGQPMIQYVIDVAKAAGSLKTCVVIGHQADIVRRELPKKIDTAIQRTMLGTGDAVRSAQSLFNDYRGDVLILCGDTPLLDKNIVKQLVAKHRKLKNSCTILSADMDNPRGYGRIVRDQQKQVTHICEQKDADKEIDALREINTGVYVFKSRELFDGLKKIKINPSKKEYYLTDIVSLLLSQGKKVGVHCTKDQHSALGINSRVQLAEAETVMRQKINEKHMLSGVTIVDPATTYISANVKIGKDTTIHPMTVIEGNVTIGKNCSIGPMARLRPGVVIKNDVSVGNFIEVSRSTLGNNVTAKHFGFIGDAEIGQGANIGAGVVTANYDGKNKNKTRVGANAFIGSDAVIVAPATIGAEATIGAGSVVTKNTTIPKGAVAKGVPAKITQRKRR